MSKVCLNEIREELKTKGVITSLSHLYRMVKCNELSTEEFIELLRPYICRSHIDGGK